MAKHIYSVLPRIEHDDTLTSGWGPLLIFPATRERDGSLGAYAKIGQHCSADPKYIREDTRPPRTVEEWRACLDLIEEERTLGPKEEWENLEARIITRFRS